MPVIKGIRVTLSRIHGYGVIATRSFKKGEVISDVDGVLRHEDEDFDDTYSLHCDGAYFFDMVDQTRWINHSCDPNCIVERGINENGEGWARIIAIRDIESGEELAYSYAFSAEVAEPCSCGAKKCRGWIVKKDEIGKLAKRLGKKERKKLEKMNGLAH